MENFAKSARLRGRFAPSPSGFMHLGNAWTALLAWLDIRKLGGSMVLRMEDLDPQRSKDGFAEALMQDMRWLGLDWDEGPDVGGAYGPYKQSERTGFYEATLEILIQKGLVYPCFCSRAELRNAATAPHAGESEYLYSGRCSSLSAVKAELLKKNGRRPSLRLRVDTDEISFNDELYGQQSQNLRQICGDFVIRRADGVFAYQLAVVIDDAAMAINRVVRGADLLASTPRQIRIWRLLGAQPPAFLHVPLLYGTDGSRLSKRHGSLALHSLRQSGVRPEVILGQLAAWAGMLEKPEPVRANELIELFSIERLPKKPVIVGEGLSFDNSFIRTE
jgi:glutamyl-tRNA synthetase